MRRCTWIIQVCYMLPFLLLSAFLIYLFFEVLLELRKEKGRRAFTALFAAALCFLFMLNSGYGRTLAAVDREKKELQNIASWWLK